jgi:predicted permease
VSERDAFRRDRRPWPAEIARDIEEELASHLDEVREELNARGVPEEEAAAAAARRFGNRETVAAACREIDRRAHASERRIRMLTDLRQDLGYALRLFRRHPGFTAIAILTLALGMGATTTIFTLSNWALLRPVPGVRDPGNVSVIWVGTFRSSGSFTVSSLSYPNLADIASRLQSLTIAGYQRGGGPVAGGGQLARTIDMQYVTASYFDVLGVRMQLGRTFTAAEDAPPSPAQHAVISDRLWQSMYHRSPDALGKTLDVAGIPFIVVGVAAPQFHGTERLSTTDLWLPGSSQGIVRRMPTLRYEARNGPGFYELVARLKPGASWSTAKGELESLRAWLREQFPKENGKFDRDGLHVMGPIGPHPLGRTMMQKIVGWTSFGASALVLLIACANVAGLLIIKGIGRRQETAVRKALGAGRGRLLRQHLTEGLLLWAAGGAAALGLLFLIRETFDIAGLMGMGAIEMVPPIDWRVLAFTAGVSLLVGVVFSAVPGIRATRADAAETMRAAGQSVTHRRFVGTSLAVFQLAAALTLLVGALLLVGTLRNLAAVPLGFEADGLHVFIVQPAAVGYKEAESLAYMEEFQRRLRQVPGIMSVSASRAAPFLGSGHTRRIRLADAAPDARPVETNYNYVFDSAFFSTLRIPVVRGRAFSEAEVQAGRRGDARVVMLSDGLARRLFGTIDPVGRVVQFADGPAEKTQRWEVVGIAGTAKYRNLAAPADDIVYEPALASGARREIVMTVRAASGTRVAEEARQIAKALNPSLPLSTLASMTEWIGRARRDWDSLGRLLGILAGLAALLSSVGLYGVIGHGVEQRRREFGIRAALGASRRDMWRLVMRQSATIVGGGVVLGSIGAYLFAQTLSSRLVGVSALDPASWTLAAALLVAAAIAASIKPAITAARVDVNATLRAL